MFKKEEVIKELSHLPDSSYYMNYRVKNLKKSIAGSNYITEFDSTNLVNIVINENERFNQQIKNLNLSNIVDVAKAFRNIILLSIFFDQLIEKNKQNMSLDSMPFSCIDLIMDGNNVQWLLFFHDAGHAVVKDNLAWTGVYITSYINGWQEQFTEMPLDVSSYQTSYARELHYKNFCISIRHVTISDLNFGNLGITIK